MEDASPALFRPTCQQAFGRGLYLGALVALGVVAVAALVSVAALVLLEGVSPPPWLWAVLAFGPPAAGALIGVVAGRRAGTQISSGGIRILSAAPGREAEVAPWDQVVDLRAERRGGRTVVSVYLHSGASVQLNAPYSGGLFAADPRFEGKMIALSYLWRSNRFGGLPG